MLENSGTVRIMQLRSNENFEREMIQGIKLPEGILSDKYVYIRDFAKIIPYVTPREPINMELAYEVELRDMGDGFVDIRLNNVVGKNLTNDENQIMVILQMLVGVKVKLTGKAEKVAGRFRNEGIFILNPNDSIVLCTLKKEEVYTAVKIKNHMYLIKEY